MRIKNALDCLLTIDFYSLREDTGIPEFADSFFFFPNEENDISIEELGNSNFIALFHTYKGISIRLLQKGAKSFRPETASAKELFSNLLISNAYEPIVNNLKTDTNLWYNPPLCVVSEQTRC